MKNQGKKPSQTKFSEDASFYSLIGLLVTLLITIILK
jgi:ACR3 family arsenite efflux pump ArsB